MSDLDPVWEHIKKTFPPGTKITGKVVKRAPFGVFVDIGVGIEGLLLVPYFAPSDSRPNANTLEGYASIGDKITAWVKILGDDHRIGLTQRPDNGMTEPPLSGSNAVPL